MPTRVLIADDDATIRLLLRRLLEKQPDLQVCGDASNGVEAIEKVDQLEPDVVVMDLGMPVMTGLQAATKIVEARPRLPMLLISVQEVSKELAWEARHAGFRGAVTKSTGIEVLKGIEALIRHEMFFYGDNGSSISPSAGELRDLSGSIEELQESRPRELCHVHAARTDVRTRDPTKRLRRLPQKRERSWS